MGKAIGHLLAVSTISPVSTIPAVPIPIFTIAAVGISVIICVHAGICACICVCVSLTTIAICTRFLPLVATIFSISSVFRVLSVFGCHVILFSLLVRSFLYSGVINRLRVQVRVGFARYSCACIL